MNKQHFTGFLAALAVTAAIYSTLDVATATTPELAAVPR